MKLTPEERAARRSAAQKARWADPEARAAAKAKWADPDYRARVVAKMKAVNSTPEVRARHSAAQKKRLEDPEVHARQSESMKKVRKEYFDDPDFRAHHSAAMQAAVTPELRQLRSDNFWSKDPETQARMLAAMLAKGRERRRAEKASKAKSATAGK